MTAAIHAEHARRLRDYESAADQMQRAAVAAISYENASRLVGAGTNTTVMWAALRVPRTVGDSITTGSMAAAIERETAKQHNLFNL